MLHILCYFAAGLVNLMWLLLGDHLDLFLQTAAPAVTVLLAGTGVALRLRSLPREAGARYLRGRCGPCSSIIWPFCPSSSFSEGCSSWTGCGRQLSIWSPSTSLQELCAVLPGTGSPVSIMNLLGNAVIMVPMGLLLPLLFQLHVPFLDLPAPVCPDRGGGGVAPVGSQPPGPPTWTTPF